MTQPDKLHYVRISQGQGGRAEMTRMTYILADKPYVDVFWSFADARQAVLGKNPFKQFPFVETPDGKTLYQTLAIMHHVASGTPIWPSNPELLTQALAVGMAGYDLYQWFGGFSADDLVAKKKFEERRAPQFFVGFDEIYRTRAFSGGDVPTFADPLVHQAIVWCVRRNEVCKKLLDDSPSLKAFIERFESLPTIKAFMARQVAARQADDSV